MGWQSTRIGLTTLELLVDAINRSKRDDPLARFPQWICIHLSTAQAFVAETHELTPHVYDQLTPMFMSVQIRVSETPCVPTICHASGECDVL